MSVRVVRRGVTNSRRRPSVPTSGSGGSGGPFTDRVNVAFTASNGLSSKYHAYASGLSQSTPMGLVLQLHGDDAFEFLNPTSSYSLGGQAGIVAVSRARGFLTVPALAPDTTGSVTWWENGAAEALYLRELVQYLYTQYNIDKRRVWVVGYSGGSQQTTKFLVPLYPDFILGGGSLVFGGGGAPTVTPATFSTDFKASFPMHWYTGLSDDGLKDDGTIDGDGYDAHADAQRGVNWYVARGFNVTFEEPAGVTHTLDGTFGGILARHLNEHGYTPLGGLGPALAGTWTATRTASGMTWVGKTVNAGPVLLRASASPLTGQTGFYTYSDPPADGSSQTLSLTAFTAGNPYYWRIESTVAGDGTTPASGVTILASGQLTGTAGNTQTGS